MPTSQDPENKPRRKLVVVTATVITAALVTAIVVFRGSTDRPRGESPDVAASAAAAAPDLAALRGGSPFNVVLVTLDTTRADRIGAYGFDGVQTPTIDALATRGVLFRRAYSPVPLTLPAHVSLLTGEYPLDHGVRDNGGFAVPEELTTAAEVFREHGYRTAAFIASYVLAARWGLDQGFDTYVDGLGAEARRATVMNEVQRPANEVIDDALEWIAGKPRGPFFLWVHLYDAHSPYAPPEPFRTRYADDPYVGEIAFMDQQVGRLLQGVREAGEEEHTFVVVAGDHGESLGEHGELEHGFFVYEAAIHVPLIVSLPFGDLQGISSNQLVSLIDVMPTVLAMNGIPAPAGVQGQSLTNLFVRDPPERERVVYAETYYPRLHYGWSELTAILDRRYKLIVSPEPELYDVIEDPAEADNLAADRVDDYDRLQQIAGQMVAAANPAARRTVEVDAAARRTLESLGYLAGGAPSSADSGTRAAPRARIELFNKSLRARSLMGRGELDEAARLYDEILDEDPTVTMAYERLGDIYMLQRRFADAEEVFFQAVPLRPDWHEWYIKLAEAQLGLDNVDAAEQTLLGSLDRAPPVPDTFCLLGHISERETDYTEAAERYQSCLDLDPTSAVPLAGLARVHLELGDLAGAERDARKALDIDPTIPAAHFVLAQVHTRRGEPEQAVAEYAAEVEINPDHAGAHFGLAMYYGESGRPEEEERHLERVLEVEPENAVAALFLANNLFAQGKSYERAVALATAAVEKPLAREDLAAGYFILSNLHQRLGNTALAREYLQKAESLRAP